MDNQKLSIPKLLILVVFGFVGLVVLSEVAAGFSVGSATHSLAKFTLTLAVFGGATVLPIWIIGLYISAKNSQIALATCLCGLPLYVLSVPGSPVTFAGAVLSLCIFSAAYVLGALFVSLPFLALKYGFIKRLFGARS